MQSRFTNQETPLSRRVQRLYQGLTVSSLVRGEYSKLSHTWNTVFPATGAPEKAVEMVQVLESLPFMFTLVHHCFLQPSGECLSG